MLNPVPSIFHRSSSWSVVKDYIALTKPPIIALLALTALSAMFLAAQGAPPFIATILVMIGGGMAAGGANALNQYLERDIDHRMGRTRTRPVPSKRIKPKQAFWFGIGLNVVAFALLSGWVNLLSACLALSATLFYVLVYTQWLKRSTTQNIVVGGAAGAIPPIIGWAAVTGGVGLPALYMFAIVFFWTPPHFWALALLITQDYKEANVPMLPVVKGTTETVRGILLHSVLLITITLLFFTVEQLGWIYFAGASALGIWFLLFVYALYKDPTPKRARPLYLFSMLYLALLFGVIALDGVL